MRVRQLELNPPAELMSRFDGPQAGMSTVRQLPFDPHKQTFS